MRWIVLCVFVWGAVQAADPGLVWHVATADGEAPVSRGADRPVNPASVTKLATTLWALTRLDADHRFETRFALRGGDLLVVGGHDPDFHVENASLVAAALEGLGVREVGALRVDPAFRIGWDDGPMAARLRDALDPRRWDAAQLRAMRESFARRGVDAAAPPRVVVRGEVGTFDGAVDDDEVILVHRSNPLTQTLKRFNSYSNNDIERLGAVLGAPDEMAAFLRTRWGAAADDVVFASLSGLGVNRLTPRLMVRLVDDLQAVAKEHGLALADLLPQAGCDPGTLDHFPALEDGPLTRAVVGKTGSLTRTDGGVAVLAGVAFTAAGPRAFSVAAPGVGHGLRRARARQERWLIAQAARLGGAAPQACRAPVVFSDHDARVEGLR